MKFIKPIMYAGLISVMLAGCGTANNNDRFTSDDNKPLGVRYNPTDNRDGANNMNDGIGVNDNRNDGFGTNVNTRNNDNMGNNNNDRNIDLADDVADEVVSLKEVDDASVLVTNRNAYVAVKLSNQGNNEMSKDVQKKIDRKVRETKHNFDNVYISENPDFYDRMRGYGNDIRNGRPIGGFFDEFSNTVQRVFPNAR
ncbi:YhcN/YlaJ family sporulation lipoprotein [Siminovitchia acidinfaciens]|uniref:YhcN/YlaJ family sporulation lipoprotein n=1 Tax=Siminovitchia acidinfaciens TaxID=2321395 RepID=A0A429Y4R3_9BACI|nr:YhcN/YlaJ family sporulation lipoprotein [Siminovitchia acidinfaciens]RST76422.1 YhcN/YlaJ family sporulation lipoprotein [Siminovitchia acidinfaciens]VEF47263.1 lipoprotein [Bacillus freudenreichii]